MESGFQLSVVRKDETRFLFSHAGVFRAELTLDFDKSMSLLGRLAPSRMAELLQAGRVAESQFFAAREMDAVSDKNAESFIRDLSESSLQCPSCGVNFRAVKGATFSVKGRESFAFAVDGMTVEFSLPKQEIGVLTNLLADTVVNQAKSVELHPSLTRLEFIPQEHGKQQFALSGSRTAA